MAKKNVSKLNKISVKNSANRIKEHAEEQEFLIKKANEKKAGRPVQGEEPVVKQIGLYVTQKQYDYLRFKAFEKDMKIPEYIRSVIDKELQ